jgi:hypothetical protein
MKHETAVEGALFVPGELRILAWSLDKRLRLWDVSWRGDNLFEIACNHTPPVRDLNDMYRLSNRYGIGISELICQPGIKIPDPDWSRIERAKEE